MRAYSLDSWLCWRLIKRDIFQMRPTLGPGHPRFGTSAELELEKLAVGSPLAPIVLGIQLSMARMSELTLPDRRSSLNDENWSLHPFQWPQQCLYESQRAYLGLLLMFRSILTWAARRFAQLGHLLCLCNCFSFIGCCVGSHPGLLLRI